MKIIEKKLYLTLQECVESGLNERTIVDAKNKGSKCWVIINDPADNRKLLVSYEDIAKPENKRKVDERFGNVYDQVARQPILGMVENDHKALEFYKGYRYDNGTKYLPLTNSEKYTGGTVYKYTRAASWLNMLDRIDKRTIRSTLNISLADFYMHVEELVQLERTRGKTEGYQGADVLPGDFPSNYRRLYDRLATYKKEGYECLIDPRMGNKCAAKIGKITPAVAGSGIPSLKERGELAPHNTGLLPSPEEVHDHIYGPKYIETDPNFSSKGGELVPIIPGKGGAFDPQLFERQMAVIRYCAELGNNLNAAQVQKMAKIIFDKNGWECPSVRRIRQIMNENTHVLTPGRKGKRAYLNTVGMQNKRRAPQYPMVYVTLDGWTAELLYKSYVPGKGMSYSGRMVLVVVLDPHKKYPLGYAIGDREDTSLIKMACRNAIMHAHELFGDAYQPLQVQSDRYQVKNLQPFYQAVAGLYYTPAEAHNAKAKVIEPYFNYLNDLCQSRYPNWSGHNINASQDNQVNREYMDAIKESFPDREGVIQQLHALIESERKRKRADYVEKWAELPVKDRKVMSVEDYLMVFGQPLGERTSSITGQGIIKTIKGEQYTYDSFDPEFRKNLMVKWQLIGDEENLQRVLAVSPDSKLRFVLERKRELPMDLYSTTQEDVDYRMRVKNYNKDRMAEITDQYGQDADTMREVLGSTPGMLTEQDETDLKLMFVVNGQQKERIQDAKGLRKAQKMVERAEAKDDQRIANAWDQQQQRYLEDKTDFSIFRDEE